MVRCFLQEAKGSRSPSRGLIAVGFLETGDKRCNLRVAILGLLVAPTKEIIVRHDVERSRANAAQNADALLKRFLIAAAKCIESGSRLGGKQSDQQVVVVEQACIVFCHGALEALTHFRGN